MKDKKVLIISNYFPPETGAASNRIFHLAHGLKSFGYEVKVLAPLPNYPHGRIFKGYRNKFWFTETIEDLPVRRFRVLANRSKNIISRLFAMLSFSIGLSFYFLFNRIPSLVIVQSPPLLVAYTSIKWLNSKKRRMVLNVSDLWPLAGLKLGAFKPGILYSTLKRIERYNYQNADLVMGQSMEILEHVSSMAQKGTFLYRNFPNTEFSHSTNSSGSNSKIRMVYAGLIGVAQGIPELCRRLDYSKIEFHIYGTGADSEIISDFVAAHPDKPIVYHGEISRQKLHKELINFDLAIIPLADRIYGSVPSKIFEYAKLGLPLMYFGGGEGESLVKNHQLGWVANAGDYDHLNHIISQITPEQLSAENKDKIKQKAAVEFDFNAQLARFAEKLGELDQ